MMMMNVFAVCLLLGSLVTTGVWSQEKQQNNPREEDVIVKEGHRIVVVEYDKQVDHESTKVSISPPETQQVDSKEKLKSTKGAVEDAKEKFKEVVNHHHHSPRELVCDALGTCKHKVASAIGRAKDKVSERAKEAASEAKETVLEKVHRVEEGAKTVEEHVRRNVTETVKSGAKTVQDVAREKDVKKVFGREMAYLGEVMDSVMGVVELLGFSMAYGVCMWVTFVSSYVLGRVLKRYQFGIVQSKIFPVYFRVMEYSVFVALVGHLWRQRLFNWGQMFQVYYLLASLLLLLINSLCLEPLANKVMFEKIKMEKEESRGRDSSLLREPESSDRTTVDPVADPPAVPSRRGVDTTTSTPPTAHSIMQERREQEVAKSQIVELSERLKKLNAYSSFLNILTLVSLTWHLVYLGQRLHLSC